MYPHERSLVKKMVDKPFVLIGVNSDSKERVQQAIVDNDITWRSFWDGGATGGPIAKAWSVRGWPTIYVIDDRGVIRYKNVRGTAMDAAVEELVEEYVGNLVHDLENQDPDVRGLAAFRMGKYHAPDAKDSLTALLDDAELVVRQRSAVGLALLGEPAVSLLPLVREAVADADPEIRVSSLEVLGNAGDQGSSELAISALEDGQIDVRRAAIRVLGMLKPQTAVAPLASAIDDPDRETAKTAALSLAEFKTAKSTAALKELAANPEHPARVWIAVALHRAGEAGSAERFERLFGDEDASVRRQTLVALGDLTDFDATDLYIRALDDESAAVLQVARTVLSSREDLRAIEALKESLIRQIEELLPLLADQDYRKHRKASGKLRQLGPAAAPLLLDYLESVSVAQDARSVLAGAIARLRNPAVIEPAMERLRNAELDTSLRPAYETILGRLGGDANEAAFELIKNEQAVVRESGVRLLSRRRDAEAVDALNEALEDSARRVRVHAAGILARRRDENALAVLRETVEGDEAEIRLLVVNGLARYDAESSLPVLVEMTDDTDRSVRSALVSALGRFKDPQASEAIVEIMTNDADMRFAAVNSLRRQDTPGAATALGELLKEEDSLIRRQVRSALTRMRNPEAKRVLEEADRAEEARKTDEESEAP